MPLWLSAKGRELLSSISQSERMGTHPERAVRCGGSFMISSPKRWIKLAPNPPPFSSEPLFAWFPCSLSFFMCFLQLSSHCVSSGLDAIAHFHSLVSNGAFGSALMCGFTPLLLLSPNGVVCFISRLCLPLPKSFILFTTFRILCAGFCLQFFHLPFLLSVYFIYHCIRVCFYPFLFTSPVRYMAFKWCRAMNGSFKHTHHVGHIDVDVGHKYTAERSVNTSCVLQPKSFTKTQISSMKQNTNNLNKSPALKSYLSVFNMYHTYHLLYIKI